jgi:hypothetical protein
VPGGISQAGTNNMTHAYYTVIVFLDKDKEEYKSRPD